MGYLGQAHNKATERAIGLGIPKDLWPDIEHSTLRVLEYPPTTLTPKHTDFSLFTLMCYRNIKGNFRYLNETNDQLLNEGRELSENLVFGDVIQTLMPRVYKATPHEVIADEFGRTQFSIVYFAMANPNAKMPNGTPIGDLIKNRKEGY